MAGSKISKAVAKDTIKTHSRYNCGKVLNSRATINKFYPIIKEACSNGKVTIEIK